MSRSPFMSPDDAAAAPVPVEAAVEVELSFLSSPHAASSTPSAPAAPAPPRERRKRLRDESSRASSSSAPPPRGVSWVWSVIVSFLDEFGFAGPYERAGTTVVCQARRRYARQCSEAAARLTPWRSKTQKSWRITGTLTLKTGTEPIAPWNVPACACPC